MGRVMASGARQPETSMNPSVAARRSQASQPVRMLAIIEDQQFTAARFHKLPKENDLPERLSCDFGSQGCRFEPCRVQIRC